MPSASSTAAAAGPSFQLRPASWEAEEPDIMEQKQLELEPEPETTLALSDGVEPAEPVDDEISEEIPDFVRAWDKIVERADPDSLPEGWQNWGLDIALQNIYVKRAAPDEEGVFVVPSKCTRCREKKKSCDRSVPCSRCIKVGDKCVRANPREYRFKKAPRSGSFSQEEKGPVEARSKEKSKVTSSRRITGETKEIDKGTKKRSLKRKISEEDIPLMKSLKRSRKVVELVQPETPTLVPEAEKPEKGVWYPVKNEFKSEPVKKKALQERPRIWAASRDELTSTYPPLLKTTCNVAPLVSFAPMILLDNDTFPDGSWAEDGISMTLLIQKRYVRSTGTKPKLVLHLDGDKPEGAVELPQDLPEDIKALSDTHLTGAVILAFAANKWNALPFQLPPEYEYSVLGYYHVTGVEHLSSRTENANLGRIAYFFSWRISLRWVAGGHEPLGALKSGSFEYPWWLSKSQFGTVQASASKIQNVECFTPSELNCMLVPRKVSNGATNSRTWLCASCGKLNFCGWMGGQGCESSVCKNDEDNLCYPRELKSVSSIRNKKRFLMDNELVKHRPPDATQTVEKSTDGAKLYTYTCGKVEVRHILTNGAHNLEVEADKFFLEMQTKVKMVLVPLRGSSKNNLSTLLFSHLERPIQVSEETPMLSSRKNAPPFFLSVKEHMIGVVKQYFGTKLSEKRFEQFDAHSWMESCTAKEKLFFKDDGVDKRVLLICLGADVEITVGLEVQANAHSKTKGTSKISKASHEGLHLMLPHGSILFITGPTADLCVNSVHGFSMVLATCDVVS